MDYGAEGGGPVRQAVKPKAHRSKLRLPRRGTRVRQYVLFSESTNAAQDPVLLALVLGSIASKTSSPHTGGHVNFVSNANSLTAVPLILGNNMCPSS